MLRHIVFFKIHETTTKEQLEEATNILRRLGNQRGVVKWRITPSLDTRKGTILVQNGLFTNEKAFTAFKESSLHEETVEYMKKISDWLVGDYIE